MSRIVLQYCVVEVVRQERPSSRMTEAGHRAQQLWRHRLPIHDALQRVQVIGLAGCAGNGGGGGGGGGSSIALLSSNAALTLIDTTLSSGDGGVGGNGGAGQPGGGGGSGGAAGTGGCRGGVGGSGGAGGPGGGGLGGHALAIAFHGSAPLQQGDTTLSFGEAASGGLDGDGSTLHAGDSGVAAAEQSF